MKLKNLSQFPAYTETVIQPQFHDLDPMNIVWHGNYVKYLEVARCALLQTIDYDYPQMQASGYAWPVVDMRLKYVRPIAYAQPVIVACAITEWENRLKINYEIKDAQTMRVLHRAYTTQVAVAIRNFEMCYQSPDVLLQKINACIQNQDITI